MVLKELSAPMKNRIHMHLSKNICVCVCTVYVCAYVPKYLGGGSCLAFVYEQAMVEA